MATQAFLGIGTQLLHSATSGGTYAPIAQVKDLKGPSINLPHIDITNNDSPVVNGVAWMEKLQGIADPGKLSGKMLFKAGQISSILGLAGLGTTFFKIIFPNGGVWTLSGFLCKIESMESTADVITADFEIDLTGVPLYSE